MKGRINDPARRSKVRRAQLLHIHRIHAAIRGFFMQISFRFLVSLCLVLVSVALNAQKVEVVLTTPDLGQALAVQPTLAFAASTASSSTEIVVDPAQRFQSIDGFGAAMTDSAAWLLEEQLTPAQRDQTMRKLFDPKQGIGISFLRVPLGASDLARNHYSYDEMPSGQRDPGLEHFSIDHDKAYILPAMRQALELNPAISVMLSPWSPPGWMKTKDSMIGGSLRDDASADFAAYLSRSVSEYEKAGVPVKYLSLQNEPLYETKDYPGTLMLAAQQAKLIGSYVGPALAAAGHPSAILAYDHNWDHPEYPLEVLSDAAASPYTAGSAFHCYGGDVTAQSEVHQKFPAKGLWMTECSGGTWQKGDVLAITAQLLIESSRNWSKAVVLWGLALDQKNGPNAGGCDTCRGLVTIDRSAMPARPSFTADYYAIGHASRFVHPGAVRIASTDLGRASLETVAFQNSDRSVVLIVLNNAASAQTFTIAWHGKRISSTLPSGALATYLWR
jgi:glucosylceramidase